MRIPVTTIAVGPCRVMRVRDMGTFTNVQIAYGIAKHSTKPISGHIKKAGVTQKPRFLKDVRTERDDNEIKPGTVISVSDVFSAGDAIRVTGVSKGKGFEGVVKRHGFAGGPRTHGQSDKERAPGSIGQTTTPGRVYKGKRMAGRMGGNQVTVIGLRVFAVDSQKNQLIIKGLVPGSRGGLLLVQKE